MALCIVLQSVQTLVNEVAGCSAFSSLELRSFRPVSGIESSCWSKRESPQLLAIFAASAIQNNNLYNWQKSVSYCACTFSVPETGQSSRGSCLKDHSSADGNGYYVVAPKMVILLNPHASPRISW